MLQGLRVPLSAPSVCHTKPHTQSTAASCRLEAGVPGLAPRPSWGGDPQGGGGPVHEPLLPTGLSWVGLGVEGWCFTAGEEPEALDSTLGLIYIPAFTLTCESF